VEKHQQNRPIYDTIPYRPPLSHTLILPRRKDDRNTGNNPMTTLYISLGALFAIMGVVGYLLIIASSRSSRAEARADEMLRNRQ